jgi:hypothetical protein
MSPSTSVPVASIDPWARLLEAPGSVAGRRLARRASRVGRPATCRVADGRQGGVAVFASLHRLVPRARRGRHAADAVRPAGEGHVGWLS